MKVLTLGSDTQAKEIFPPDTEFDKVFDPEKKGYYDAIFVGHYLQLQKRKEVAPLLRELRDSLVEGGELWVTVPSLEYVALQILKDDQPNFSYFTALYGDDANPHQCGFRLMDLRMVVQGAGYEVRRAIQEAYAMAINGQQVLTMQNLVIGAKYDGDAAEALG